MERLQERAGKKPDAPTSQTHTQTKLGVAQSAPEKKMLAKAKAEEIVRAPTPEPSANAKGGLSGLLGGWWGRS